MRIHILTNFQLERSGITGNASITGRFDHGSEIRLSQTYAFRSFGVLVFMGFGFFYGEMHDLFGTLVTRTL